MTDSHIKPQKGAPNGKWHVANVGAVRERGIDYLRCAAGVGHDVRDTWETRDGMRTGALVIYCWTCRRPVEPQTQTTPPDTEKYKDSARFQAFIKAKKGAA